MEELCTACLCVGRNLYYIGDTGVFDLYSQILNEIPLYNTSELCVRICWECQALLRRLQRFRQQVKQSYQLLSQVQDNSTQSVARPPHLNVEHISNISLPFDDFVLKPEPDPEANKPVVEEAPEVKSEPDDNAEHCEETFVNDFEVEKPEEVLKTKTKEKTKKKLKVKDKKQKSEKTVKKKVRKRKRKKSISSESLDDIDVGIDCDTGSIENGDLEGENVVQEGEDVMEERAALEGAKEFEVPIEGEVRVSDKKEVVEEEKVTEKAATNGVVRAPRVPVVENERPQCVECGKVFSSRKTYRYHLNVLHKGQNRYPCPRCGKVYQWKSNLGRHMRTHKARDAGELYCSPCDKRFASVATYRQHLKVSRQHVSESEFSFMCTECGKKFVNKTRLRDHVDWEHLHNIKFRCQLCNKPFKCHTSLYVHMQNVHRNKEMKNNLCHVCGKSYQNAAKLKYHIIAMHTHETPYRCAHCSAAFGWYSSLYRHVREVHYKMKVQPKKSKRPKRAELPLPHPVHPVLP